MRESIHAQMGVSENIPVKRVYTAFDSQKHRKFQQETSRDVPAQFGLPLWPLFTDRHLGGSPCLPWIYPLNIAIEDSGYPLVIKHGWKMDH